MFELYAITSDSIPKRLNGIEAGFALRSISTIEILSIEDYFFSQGQERKLAKSSSAVIFPEASKDPVVLEEGATLAEFSLSLLTLSGHPSFSSVALFDKGHCILAKHLGRSTGNLSPPKFSSTLTAVGAREWLKRCILARNNSKDRMHITANRYVRYAKAPDLSDSLLDLSISLESLLDSQTEISFRFGVSLAKVTGETGKKASEIASLLSELYDLRSKLAHGDPSASKLLKKFEPKLPLLRKAIKRILTTYILFMSEHSRDEWKSHVRDSLFS
jgi:hypothetical protein